MRVFGTDAGLYVAGEAEEAVIGYLLRVRGEEGLRGLYEIHPEMVKLLEVSTVSGRAVSFPELIESIRERGGRFPHCIAVERDWKPD